jgi:tRNA A37 threonylcarbamoyladenosine biosynthesis protein TsaE
MQIISKSVEETQNIAKDLAKDIIDNKKPNVVLLEGELGGGKTTFSQGFLTGISKNKSSSNKYLSVLAFPNSFIKEINVYRKNLQPLIILDYYFILI